MINYTLEMAMKRALVIWLGLLIVAAGKSSGKLVKLFLFNRFMNIYENSIELGFIGLI